MPAGCQIAPLSLDEWARGEMPVPSKAVASPTRVLLRAEMVLSGVQPARPSPSLTTATGFRRRRRVSGPVDSLSSARTAPFPIRTQMCDDQRVAGWTNRPRLNWADRRTRCGTCRPSKAGSFPRATRAGTSACSLSNPAQRKHQDRRRILDWSRSSEVALGSHASAGPLDGVLSCHAGCRLGPPR